MLEKSILFRRAFYNPFSRSASLIMISMRRVFFETICSKSNSFKRMIYVRDVR